MEKDITEKLFVFLILCTLPFSEAQWNRYRVGVSISLDLRSSEHAAAEFGKHVGSRSPHNLFYVTYVFYVNNGF